MKPVLVMIPALCCDEALYAGAAEALGDLVEPRVIIPAAASFADCSAQVLALCDGPFIVLGTSFGGHIARELALAAPGRILGLCIIGAGAGAVADPAGGRARGERLRGGREEEVYQSFAAIISHLPGPRGLEARDAFLAMARRGDPLRVALQNDALLGRVDRWGDLARIACPSLMLWGRHDQFSAAPDGLRIASLIPGARYAEIADCGHLPTLEAPEEAYWAIRHWLLDHFA
jgi:pimeloyl-ACP methyl ester carboxylesterase